MKYEIESRKHKLTYFTNNYYYINITESSKTFYNIIITKKWVVINLNYIKYKKYSRYIQEINNTRNQI